MLKLLYKNSSFSDFIWKQLFIVPTDFEKIGETRLILRNWVKQKTVGLNGLSGLKYCRKNLLLITIISKREFRPKSKQLKAHSQVWDNFWKIKAL